MAPVLQGSVFMSMDQLRQLSRELRQRSDRLVQRSRRVREAGSMLMRDRHKLLEYREAIETCERELAVSFPHITRRAAPPG